MRLELKKIKKSEDRVIFDFDSDLGDLHHAMDFYCINNYPPEIIFRQVFNRMQDLYFKELLKADPEVFNNIISDIQALHIHENKTVYPPALPAPADD